MFFFCFFIVIISPPSPSGVYTVEVQRLFFVACSGTNSDDIVAWIRKTRLQDLNPLLNFSLSYSAAEGEDPATVGITPATNSTDPFCPSPMPFLMNTNSSTAVLRGDDVNGTQPEHAGVYTCYSNGLPRDMVEIVVLGTLNSSR